MASVNPPLLLAFVLCDGIIREANTNKFSLIGTFNGLYAQGFPNVHPSFSVYVALTDGRGRVPCALRMLSLESGKELFSVKGHVEFRDPTGAAELVYQLQQVRFDAPGIYSLEFLADGELLGARKLNVQPAPRKA